LARLALERIELRLRQFSFFLAQAFNS